MSGSARLASLAACLIVGYSALTAEQTNPKPIKTVSPGYPLALEDTGKSGEAKVRFVVTTTGNVSDASVLAADDPAFGQAALEAAQQWEFEPGTKDGVPIDARVTLPFVFRAPPEQVFNARIGRKVFTQIPEGATVLNQKDFGERPKPTKRMRPQVPPSLKDKGIDETVKVRFVITPDGKVINPEVVEVPKTRELVLPAMAFVSQMEFPPLRKDGKPVYLRLMQPVKFGGQAPEPRAGGGGGGFGDGGGGGAGFGGGGGGGDGD